jgi:glutamate--cysteine ligase regulatory subunit
MLSSQSIPRRPTFSKSNIELINAFRTHFHTHQDSTSSSPADSQTSNIPRWTTHDEKNDTLYIPTLHTSPLAEPRDSYDITCKLFFLPGIPSSRRCRHTSEAISLVLKELGVDSIDLLLVSYPGVSFDADDDGEEELSPDEESNSESDKSDESHSLDAQVKTWRVLEELHAKGTIAQLGVSEFSSLRLEKFLPELKVQPSVDQINVKDCCVVPKSLITYAKERNIELLTHNDCTDILPCGTTRELLGPGVDGKAGAGILAAHSNDPTTAPGLKGDIEPQWVIKYTAVVKNRGVIENKGYFAVANLGSCIDAERKGTAC